MAGSRTASALLLLLAAAAFNGCSAYTADDFEFIFGKGGNGGNGGKVVQLAETNQIGYKNAATTLQKASANGGAGGNGVNLGKGFPDSFVVVGKGGNGGDGGRVYQKSVTNQIGAFNKALTKQEASADGGAGGVGVNGRKLLAYGYPKFIALVGVGGNGGNGGKVVQYSLTNQKGFFNKAKTTQEASANGGDGGAGINGRKLLDDDFKIVAIGVGGKGGNGGVIGQFSATNQLGFFNKAKTTQKANANGGNGGAGING